MEREYVVPESVEVGWAVMLVNRVHAFEPSDPGRLPHLECAIWLKTTGCEGMALECLVVRRTEHGGVTVFEPHQRYRFRHTGGADDSDVGSIPSIGDLLNVVGQDHPALLTESDGNWSAGGRLRGFR